MAAAAPPSRAWAFQDGGSWHDYTREHQEGLAAAWVRGRPEYRFTLADSDYCVDLVRLVQTNLHTENRRQVRVPRDARVEVLVEKGKALESYLSEARSDLCGTPEKDPVAVVQLTAVGRAIPVAAAVAAQAQQEGIGTIGRIQTDCSTSPDQAATQGGGAKIVIQVRSVEAVARAKQRCWGSMTKAMETQAELMPRLNFLRLMKELQIVQRAIKSGNRPGGVLSCEPVESSLLEWELCMSFPAGSALQRSLDSLAENAEDSQSHLTLRARFPLDYPRCPPEVWVCRPRLAHRSAPVTFGGRLCSLLLTTGGWQPSSSMATVFEEAQKGLLEADTEVDCTVVRRHYVQPRKLERLKTELFPTANGFTKSGVTAISSRAARCFYPNQVERLEATDKIGLPFDFCAEIYDRESQSVVSPLMFEVKTRYGQKKHCTVFEFLDGLPSTHVILPLWVMADLCIEEEEQVAVRCVSLDRISFVKVQPHSVDFYSAVRESGKETHKLLVESLSHYSALTEDTCVPIKIGSQSFNLQIVEVQPGGAARIIDNDVQREFEFKVDFEAAPDLEDEAAMKARQDRLIAKYRAKSEEQARTREEHEERRRTAIRRHFEEIRESSFAAAGGAGGDEGDVEVGFRLPDATQARGRFPDGAPVVALVAFALRSAWAEKCLADGRCPWGVQLYASSCPQRLLREGDVITRDLHRSRVAVKVECPPESDEDLFNSVGAGIGRLEEDPEEVLEAAPAPVPPPVLERSVSELLSRTIRSFEVERFIRAGVEPGEALDRYDRGETVPPIVTSLRAEPAPLLSPAPDGPELVRPPGGQQEDQPLDEHRARQLDQLTEITGADRARALQAMEVSGWDTETAANAIFNDVI